MLGYHLYALTHDPLSLGWLGLVEAGPAISLVLFGGVVADRFSRQRVALVGRMVFMALCLMLAATSQVGGRTAELGIYIVGFLIGCANAFITPANQGLEADELPDGDTMRGASLLSSLGQAAMLSGPVVSSILFDVGGASTTYFCLAVMFGLSGLTLARYVVPRPPLGIRRGDSIAARIGEGLRFAFSEQVLLGSMALDLFAVFFGGATALLPVFASDILHVGPTGFGILRSAMSVGSLLAMLIAVRHPPQAIIIFALSHNFVISFLALMVAGMCDGTSVVIRRAILRLAAPGEMRGRIAAVRMVFINSSNELGDFESGMLAGAIGAVPAVWVGGLITLAVVGLTAWRAPKLLGLNMADLEAQEAARRS